MLQALSGHTCAAVREARDLDVLIESNGKYDVHAVRAETCTGRGRSVARVAAERAPYSAEPDLNLTEQLRAGM
jgi:hypothetical protein